MSGGKKTNRKYAVLVIELSQYLFIIMLRPRRGRSQTMSY